MKTWINIHIEQNKNLDGQYHLKLRLNDSHAATIEITGTPLTYDSVKFFAGKGFRLTFCNITILINDLLTMSSDKGNGPSYIRNIEYRTTPAEPEIWTGN